MNRVYVLFDTVEMNASEFKAYLINYIHDNKLYGLRHLLGDGKNSVERHVNHHPLALAREIFGYDNIETFLTIDSSELSFLGIDPSKLNLNR